MDTICGNSKAVVSDLHTEGVRHDQLKLIYNGIDLAHFESVKPRTEVRKALGVVPETLVFVMVANLIPYKGHADLLHALVRVKESMDRPWVLWCVGRDDGIGGSLQDLTQALGLAKNVVFLGSRNDVPDLLCAADVGVLCSHEEGFSNAVLECMAAALPMVVTNVGGNAEAVIDGQHGYVVEPHNPEKLGSALVAVAKNNDRKYMGQLSRMRVKSEFTWDACIKKYEYIYRTQDINE
jgi:glycosyltransferase involved in cell wall biosynthesis